MNSCVLSGWLQGDADERASANGRRFLNFEIAVDGGGGSPVYVRVSWYISQTEGERRDRLCAGANIFVRGCLKFAADRLFVGAHEVEIIQHEAKRAALAAEGAHTEA